MNKGQEGRNAEIKTTGQAEPSICFNDYNYMTIDNWTTKAKSVYIVVISRDA